MLVLVHFHNCIEALLQSMAVCREANYGEDDSCSVIVRTYAENLRDVARVDVIATGGSSVASEDCEVRACYLLASETGAYAL